MIDENDENFLKKEFLDSVSRKLAADPLLAADLLKRVADGQAEFVKECAAQRNCEASQVILDLIHVVVDPKGFAKLTPDAQKNLMHRVITYHFPKGVTNHAPCEVKFYEMFAGKDKK